MKHLNEMCCESCREQLAEIEARANTVNDEVPPAVEAAQAFEDRRALLQMVEALLIGVAINRKSWAELAQLLPKMLARPPPPGQAE